MTFFDFGRYKKLLENPVAILSDDCKLGNEEKSVKLEFIHALNFEDAKAKWTRRLPRVNSNNLFVKMGFSSELKNKDYYIDAFNKVPYIKVLFYYGEEQIPRKFQTERFIWKAEKSKYVIYYNYSEFVRLFYMFGIDIFKLLTGEDDFCREM